MIREHGEVVAVEAGGLWVRTAPRSACEGCAARSGCGTGALAGFLAGRRRSLRVASDRPAGVGDRVVLGVGERALLAGSLTAYLLPVLWLLAGALAGDSLAGGLGMPPDAGAVPGALLALAGWWLLAGAGRVRSPRIHVLEVLPAAEESGG